MIEKIPELEATAFIIIGVIGLKMLVSVVNIHIPHYFFFLFLLIAFSITFMVHKLNKVKST